MIFVDLFWRLVLGSISHNIDGSNLNLINGKISSGGGRDDFPETLSWYSLNELNQRVIRYDCERTRATINCFKVEENRIAIECLLTHYCKKQRVKYKQGMNEIIAPFAYLKIQEDPTGSAAVELSANDCDHTATDNTSTTTSSSNNNNNNNNSDRGVIEREACSSQ